MLAQEPYPAADYQGTWTWLGVGLLVVVGGWYVALWLSTRRAPSSAPALAPPRPPADHLAEIADVEARAAAGAVDVRTAHTELSAIVRRFVSERTGIPADRMHVGELQRVGLPLVPELLAVFYPVQFAEESGGDTAMAVAMARSVVEHWTVPLPGATP